MNFEKYLPIEFCKWLKSEGIDFGDITLIANRNLFVTQEGITKESPFFVSKQILSTILEKMCKNSIYANQNTLKQGYITIEGGHRVGVIGTAVKNEKSQITHMRNINALNIRISKEVVGAANKIMKYLHSEKRVYNTLIVAPPSGGKTTLLRDIARNLGESYRVGIVDERSEIGNGKDIGKHTFVLDGCSKQEGIGILLRTMSPQVIITDEIGTKEDEEAIERLINAGVKIICTAHGYGIEDIKRRNAISALINEKVFEKIIILSTRCGHGTIEDVIEI